MLMDYEPTVILTAISDTKGNILWNTIRDDTKIQIPLEEIKKSLVRESSDWITRCKIEDSDEFSFCLWIAFYKLNCRINIICHILLPLI